MYNNYSVSQYSPLCNMFLYNVVLKLKCHDLLRYVNLLVQHTHVYGTNSRSRTYNLTLTHTHTHTHTYIYPGEGVVKTMRIQL